MIYRLARVAVSALLAVMVLSWPAAAATAKAVPTEATVIAVDYNSSGWAYLQVAQDEDTPPFETSGFDDSDWPVGQAPFGTSTGCSHNESVKTQWQPNTDLLVRRWVHLPTNAQEVRIEGTVDNDALVYLNGQLLQTVSSGSCRTNDINVVVPPEVLEPCNLLAIHGSDRGLATYLDVRVTYTTPE
ncbi:hypothetical protein [Allorhizocola rhizosphaerae]|uniref:hypothetical protein n=1 Tax=Allorhizocola rhizosphaerae TaxID=1872709 RepID=UPI000E3CBD1B|nr:hypothetical protein [Allorhizocola rhizosphaerae]